MTSNCRVFVQCVHTYIHALYSHECVLCRYIYDFIIQLISKYCTTYLYPIKINIVNLLRIYFKSKQPICYRNRKIGPYTVVTIKKWICLPKYIFVPSKNYGRCCCHYECTFSMNFNQRWWPLQISSIQWKFWYIPTYSLLRIYAQGGIGHIAGM